MSNTQPQQETRLADLLSELEAKGQHHFDALRYQHLKNLARKARQARDPVRKILFDKAQSVLDSYQHDLANSEKKLCRLQQRPQALAMLDDLSARLNKRHQRNTRMARNSTESRISEQLQTKEDHTLKQAGFNTVNKRQPNELQAYIQYRASKKQFETDKLVDAIIEGPSEPLGPLHPEYLLIRSLESMRELSPHYLSRFVGYIDTLVRLEDELGQAKGRKIR